MWVQILVGTHLSWHTSFTKFPKSTHQSGKEPIENVYNGRWEGAFKKTEGDWTNPLVYHIQNYQDPQSTFFVCQFIQAATAGGSLFV